MLGFANRARKLTFGMSATVQALKKGKVQCVILAADLSENAERKIRKVIPSGKAPVFKFSQKSDLGQFFARNDIGIIGIADAGFAKSIKKILICE